MRHAIRAFQLGVLLSVGLVSSSVPVTAQGGAKDPAVVAIADAYTKASLAGDVKAILALYTEDGVELPPNQAPVRGPAAIEAFYNEQMQSAKLTAFSLEHWESRVSGDVGYDVGAYKQTLKPADGPAVNDSGKYAVILKRVGGA
jgi:ketosteroid isomerase-like protein